VAIKVNDDIGPYFQTKKGLRQGDPLSPILFNIVVDMLAIMIERAKSDGQFEGVIPHLVDGGLSIFISWRKELERERPDVNLERTMSVRL
jgi:hypothetical protein